MLQNLIKQSYFKRALIIIEYLVFVIREGKIYDDIYADAFCPIQKR